MNEYRTDIINDSLSLKQIKDGILFGTDALALADYITAEKKGAYKNAAELCAGSGVISLLLASRGKAKKIRAVEILPAYAALCAENIALNGLEGQITAVEGDIRDPDNLYCGGERLLPHTFDMVFANPPYMQKNVGKPCKTDHKTTAKHEILCTADDVARCAARLLTNKGAFYCVYRPRRLPVLLAALEKYSLSTKKLILLTPENSPVPSLVIVKALLNAGEGTEVLLISN